MLSVSPVTSMHVNKGLPVLELARARLVTSDNTAANVLLRRFGGPEAVTRFWRSIGDTVSRLDRYEPELNRTPPGTELDTTTPAAMAATVGKLVLGDILTPASRTLLRTWMTAVATGRDRVRAGFPVDWVSGDKTSLDVPCNALSGCTTSGILSADEQAAHRCSFRARTTRTGAHL